MSELTLRLKELGEENRDLREIICNERGIEYAERLSARRHKRYFAVLCEKHPIGRTATASDVLGAANIVRGIAECAGSVLCRFFSKFDLLFTAKINELQRLECTNVQISSRLSCERYPEQTFQSCSVG